jgi:protein-S-isoprenylcysteine O-methyltransferase Ste14
LNCAGFYAQRAFSLEAAPLPGSLLPIPMAPNIPLLIDLWIWLVLLAYWFASAPFTLKTRQREGWLQRSLDAIPFWLGLYLVFTRRYFGPLAYPLYRIRFVEWLGTMFACAGLAFAFWARITIGRNWDGYVVLKHGHRLIRTGPYAIVRHPIYTGFIVGFFGSALSAARIDAFLGAAIVTASFVYKYRREEALLTGEFGEEYVDFKRSIPALFPLRGL